ncbi:hypothetical protein E4U55_007484 [Claviceps digitariae]|nr:hypothetical protein E4U55_007484 [Claviceps digitariae]
MTPKTYLIVAVLAWASVVSPTNGPVRPPVIPIAVGKMLTPEARKAGSAGGLAMPFWKDHLGWYHDGTLRPPGNDGSTGMDGPLAVPTIPPPHPRRKKDWADLEPEGIPNVDMWSGPGPLPRFVLGMRRPERAGVSVKKALKFWKIQNSSFGKRGSYLASPSVLATERDWWLYQFRITRIYWDWQMTAVHIYEPDITAVKRRIEHYWYFYGKMIWVTEFGCRHDSSRPVKFPVSPCTDQDYVNRLIQDMVDFFEADERVAAYAYPDHNEYCELCDPLDKNGTALSPAGKAYLEAIVKYS